MDTTDLKILQLLQQNARMTNAEIAAEVQLTASSVYERVRKLQDQGVIRRFTIEVDPAALGKPLTAFIRLTVAYDDRQAAGVAALRGDPDVLECYSVAGEDCYILKTRVGSPGELEALIYRLRARFTVLRSVTMIALSAIKEGGVLSTSVDGSASVESKVRSKNGNS